MKLDPGGYPALAARVLGALGMIALASFGLGGKGCGASSSNSSDAGACLWKAPRPAGYPCGGAACGSTDCQSQVCGFSAGVSGQPTSAYMCCQSDVPQGLGAPCVCDSDCAPEAPNEATMLVSFGNAIECAFGKCSCKPVAISASCPGDDGGDDSEAGGSGSSSGSSSGASSSGASSSSSGGSIGSSGGTGGDDAGDDDGGGESDDGGGAAGTTWCCCTLGPGFCPVGTTAPADCDCNAISTNATCVCESGWNVVQDCSVIPSSCCYVNYTGTPSYGDTCNCTENNTCTGGAIPACQSVSDETLVSQCPP